MPTFELEKGDYAWNAPPNERFKCYFPWTPIAELFNNDYAVFVTRNPEGKIEVLETVKINMGGYGWMERMLVRTGEMRIYDDQTPYAFQTLSHNMEGQGELRLFAKEICKDLLVAADYNYGGEIHLHRFPAISGTAWAQKCYLMRMMALFRKVESDRIGPIKWDTDNRKLVYDSLKQTRILDSETLKNSFLPERPLLYWVPTLEELEEPA